MRYVKRVARTSLAALIVTTIAQMAFHGAPATAGDQFSGARDQLKAARSWGYQLQNVTAPALARTDFDLLVVDAGSGDGTWGLSQEEVKRLKAKPDGTRRLVVAYMNIGEAEDYRYYWKKAWAKKPPQWMGSENCRWKGDHRVRHWEREWHEILYGSPKSYLGRLIDAGYDGVYLDRVDIYYHWRATRWQAATDMVDLVAALAAYARQRRPGFLIIPQNGEELVSDPRYLATIDGIGKEDMLFGDRGNDKPNAAERVARAERNFAPLRAAGLPVFAVEYMRRAENVETARARLDQLGFISYFGPRSLAYIGRDGPLHPEDGDTESVNPPLDGGACE
ncbi:MAG: endo alpha-1,4 polygalactosaminidase [Hyphomicrobiaceae bacterium]|nr:endo alpha-1,4 polygalactosaminidase [Hyphomicrobiaceae bacterium]